jgi:hypothetical protein
MTDIATAEPRRKWGWKKIAVMFLAGGVAGYAAGYLLADQIDAVVEGPNAGSRLAALAVAVIYGITALMVLGGLINPRIGARFLNVEDAEELIEQRRLLTASATAMLATAAILALLALAAPAGPLAPGLVGGVCAVLLAVAATAAVRQHRHSDELMREVVRDASVWSLGLIEGAAAVWAGGAHLGFFPGPSPLDILTAIVAATLIGALIAAGRRGLLNPR